MFGIHTWRFYLVAAWLLVLPMFASSSFACTGDVIKVIGGQSVVQFPVEEGSLAAQYPAAWDEIKRIIDEIPSAEDGIDFFKKEMGGKPPTNQQILNFIVRKREEMASRLESFLGRGPQFDYFLTKVIGATRVSEKKQRRTVKFLKDKLGILIRFFDRRSSQTKDLFDEFKYRLVGDFGEFEMALRLSGVEAQGLYVKTTKSISNGPEGVHQSAFGDAVSAKIDWIEENLDTIDQLKIDYPYVFGRDIKVSSREELAKKVFDWIQSKELDLILKNGEGQFRVLEIKNYDRVLSVEELYESPYGGKSVFDQQMEVVEVLDFLELDNYKPAILLKGGITEEAAEHLRKRGIKVFGVVP